MQTVYRGLGVDPGGREAGLYRPEGALLGAGEALDELVRHGRVAMGENAVVVGRVPQALVRALEAVGDVHEARFHCLMVRPLPVRVAHRRGVVEPRVRGAP